MTRRLVVATIRAAARQGKDASMSDLTKRMPNLVSERKMSVPPIYADVAAWQHQRYRSRAFRGSVRI